MHGLTIDYGTATAINKMSTKGAGKEGSWKSIETSEKNHKMKCAINSRMPNNWCKDHLAKFLSHIKDKIFDKMLKNTDYMIG